MANDESGYGSLNSLGNYVTSSAAKSRAAKEAADRALIQNFSNQNGASIYGSTNEQLGEVAGRQNAQTYYGSQRQIGLDAQDYRDRIKSNLDEKSSLANRMTQVANQDIARANAKAGLGGVDTTAASIRERRNSIGKSNEIQQSQDQINLSNYGKSISAGIAGTESLGAAGAGKAVAATPTPTPSYGGGPFGSIICSELYRQGKFSLRQLSGCDRFRASISEETYSGYLVIARPIVAVMKKSDKFSNLFIGWATAISQGKPNTFTKIMMPICFIIGSFCSEVKDVRRA